MSWQSYFTFVCLSKFRMNTFMYLVITNLSIIITITHKGNAKGIPNFYLDEDNTYLHYYV